MYNMPRAATVRAVTPVKLWALDRMTFRSTLQDATLKVGGHLARLLRVWLTQRARLQKRQHYKDILSRVPLLANLDQYELLKVADALRVDFYETGAVIIRQGDVGDRFYIILEGSVTVLKDDG